MEIHAGGPNAPLVLDGKAANTMQGTWSVKAGRVVLAKEPGADALGGTIIVGGGTSDQDSLVWNGSDQLDDAASVQLLSSAKGGAAARPERLQRHDRPSDAGCRERRC